MGAPWIREVELLYLKYLLLQYDNWCPRMGQGNLARALHPCLLANHGGRSDVMSHLNFNIRAAKPRPRPFNPRVTVSVNTSSVLWTMFAVMAVAGTAFLIVWFA